jgi:hypothetical protein
METDNLDELTTRYNSIYSQLWSDRLLRVLMSFEGNGNLCSEIELPKKKKSEKPKFNQTKK